MKKTLAALAAVVAATMCISGCSSSSSAAPSAASGPVALTFWHGYTEADGGVLKKIVDQFNASQTGIKITTQVKTWAVIGDTLLPALSASKGPDIVAMPAEQLPVYAAKGAFASLDNSTQPPTATPAR
ncbi:ABC-type glycerol-3-phosphate transport system substrate-binding protein [Nakamurella sp. UYEF19]|uniref:extracellular solute-binding protein n=1 Tax=Nakamurella sp. UYEF19 TaxID=1756392 RepID=UPI00339631A1